MVCSLRPSEPKASQQARRRSTPLLARPAAPPGVGEHVVQVADQLGELARAARPGRAGCARSGGCRRPRAAASAGRAPRGCAVPSCLSDRRCSANRSRSETMLDQRARARTTGTWRMPWRDISSAASCSGAGRFEREHRRAGITASIGVDSGSCGSVTRPRMSCRVRMPVRRLRRARPPASSRRAARASAAAPRPAACRARRPSSGLRASDRQRRLERLLGQRLATRRPRAARCCASSKKCSVRRFRKSANGALARASACTAAAGSSRQKVSACAV